MVRSMASTFAFVTLVSSDSYLPGALAQVAALNDLHPSPPVPPEVDFKTVCIVTPESLDVATIRSLRKAFDLVIGVEILEQENSHGLKLLGRPDLTTVLTKLHIFRLTQFKKVIFLDADVLPVRPISHLFNIPHEFSAAPDVGWPDIFNSGVLVLTPGDDKFDQLHQLIKSKSSWDGGDQGILNEWRGADWNRLSFTYNTTPTAAYTYAPAYERYGSQISAIHFIGPNKPWNSLAYRAPFAGRQPDSSDSVQRAYDYQSLVDRWYDVYDRHYRTQTILPQAPFEVQPYTSIWDQPADSHQPPPPVNLGDLKRLALEGVNASKPDSQMGDGVYKSMPIEGRIDLMRPQKLVKKEVKLEDDKEKSNPPPPFDGHIADDLDRFRGESFKYEETLSTPLARQGTLDNDQPGWQTLSTPGPSEVPSSPRLRMVSLPPTPTPVPYFSQTTADFYASESESESLLLPHTASANDHHEYHHHHPHPPPPPPQYQQQESEQHRPQVHEHREDERHDHQEQHHHQQEHHEVPRRPSSPPMMSWNPAIEPPPNVTPTSNAFPSDTYFSNIWDQTPSRQHDQTHLGPSPPDSGGFFQPPPPSVIPDTLIKQGHYRNVTGDSLGATPSPDRTKVKSVFPWEQKLRVLPGRVFPDSDAPPPSLFLSPGSQTSTTTPSTPETRGPTHPTRTMPLSPLHGLPTTLNYANAWDNIPSIQKYASRLAKPPPAPPALAPAFEDDSYRKGRRKSRDERVEVSSRDGDDEDNADDEDEDDHVALPGNKWEDDDDTDRETAKRRSTTGSVVTASLKPKKKEYRDQGVQTMTIEMRDEAVQADVPKAEKPSKRSSMTTRRYWAPATAPTLLAPTMTRDVSIGEHDLPSPNITPLFIEQRKKSPSLSPTPRSPLRSPREFVYTPPSAPKLPVKANSPPLKPIIRTTTTVVPSSPAPVPAPLIAAPVPSKTSSFKSSPSIVRQASNDSSLGSPASSIGPISPIEGYSVMSPMRKGARVWDPARGVELFKRGSEEVLARFLKMGSFDEESR